MAVTINVNASTNKALAQKAHTSLRSLLTGAPRTSGKGLKAAYVQVAIGTDSYTTGGLAVNLLAALPDWTEILTGVALPFTENSVNAIARLIAPNDSTPGNRKVQINVASTGAERAGSALTSPTIEFLILGY